jgi:hypothetical protein
MTERPFERVYTVMDYWDTPRAGFADFDGSPHAYRSIFRDDLDDYDPEYRLWPVRVDDLALALEDWAIFERWQKAYYAGENPAWPALPADRARHAEIAPVIERVLDEVPADALRATAEFRVVGGCDRPRGPLRAMGVRWTRVDDSKSAIS